MQDRKQWNNSFKVLNEKAVNLEFYTQWKYPPKNEDKR